MNSGKQNGSLRKVRVLINPKSGLGVSFDVFWAVVEKHWSGEGVDVSYQFSHDIADGQSKALRAVEDGTDTILIAGGDLRSGIPALYGNAKHTTPTPTPFPKPKREAKALNEEAAEIIASAIPNATLLIRPGEGHGMIFEVPDEIAGFIGNFLK